MLDGEQHCDHQTQIKHAQPNCFSRELYKGVLDDRSHGVFNGKVYVHPIAQKTDGKQTNKTLLLSDDRADRHEAAARDLRRRREVHARRDDRPDRPDGAVLHEEPRHRQRAGAPAADVRVRRRRARDIESRRRFARTSGADDAGAVRVTTVRVRSLSSMTTDALYQEIILEHNRKPRNFREMADADRTIEGRNPLCGDALTLWVKLDGDAIADVSFTRPGLRDLEGVGVADDDGGEGKDARRGRGAVRSVSRAGDGQARRSRAGSRSARCARSAACRGSRCA